MTPPEIAKVEAKLEEHSVALVDIKIALVQIQTLMTERARQEIPERVRKIEAVQSRMVGWGSAAIVFVPMVVKTLTDYVKGVT